MSGTSGAGGGVGPGNHGSAGGGVEPGNPGSAGGAERPARPAAGGLAGVAGAGPQSFEAPGTPIDLDNCAREPIHVPGSIQPHGVLLALDEPSLEVVIASANAAATLGSARDPVGLPLGQVLGDGPTAALRAALAGRDLAGVNPLPLPASSGAPMEAVLHRSGGLLVCELEPAPSSGAADVAGSYRAVRTAILRLTAADGLLPLAAVAAREVRALTGYDRVMVYRFDDEWNGEVIAEDKREDLNPFLGLHYPATDIPAQARALYTANWIRTIVDIGYTPVPLVPGANPRTGAPLDLSFAALRSVSPIHVEYLRNMGVAGSMSISLVHDGELKGLIACHHYAGPLHPPGHVRAAAQFLGQTLSALLVQAIEAEARTHAVATARLQAAVVQELARGGDLIDRLLDDRLLRLVDAGGAAVRLDGRTSTVGTTPSPADVERIAGWAAARGDDVVATDRLAREAPHLADLAGVASGVLAATVERASRQQVLWFRPEVVHTVDWGGDPKNKAIAVQEGDEVRLSPRKSFDRWKEVVREQSVPWGPHEVAAADGLRRHLGGLLLRQAQEDVEVARVLQRNLAPLALPPVPGLEVVGRYEPGGRGQVGGDWYDVVALPDGRAALALGDVAGHGLHAAATMAQVRNALRAYLLDDPQPTAVLRRLDHLVQRLLPEEMATALVALVDPRDGEVRLAVAGHLPPLVLADGDAAYLDEARGPALGVDPQPRHHQVVVHLAPGGTLLAFTDGLVERRGASLDDGLARLRDAARSGPRDLATLCDVLLATVGADRGDDDTAMLGVRWGGPRGAVTAQG